MNQELLPCPFCGSEPIIQMAGRNGLEVTCTNHSCTIIHYKQKVLRQSVEWLREKMIENWNTRTTTPAPVQQYSDAWISVYKALPDTEIKCWVCQNWTYIHEAYYNGHEWKGWQDFEGIDFVTHWQVFTEPQPPIRQTNKTK